MKYLRLFVVLVSLLTCFVKVEADYYQYENEQIEKNGIIYRLLGGYGDGEDEDNTAYAVVSGFTYDFEGTSVVIEDSIQVKLINWSNSDISITANIPVKDLALSDYYSQITSLTLPKTITGEIFVSDMFFFDNLEEIIVNEDNKRYSSNHGLLCNAVGDSLLYIPRKSKQFDGDILVVPLGIHYDAAVKSYNISTGDHNYINRVRYQDELYAWPRDINYIVEFWFEKNMTPPEEYQSNDYNSGIIHVPSGCATAWAEKVKYRYILEEGGNIDWVGDLRINKGNGQVKCYAYYDVDNDGEMEAVGYTEPSESYSYISSMKRGVFLTIDSVSNSDKYANYVVHEVYQDPDSENLTYFSNIVFRKDEKNVYNGIFGHYVDIDGDGLHDVVSGYKESGWNIYMHQRDGSFVETQQAITEMSEVKETSLRLPNLRDGMFLDDGAPANFGNLNYAIDINDDGILDLMDDVKGGILYSKGENEYLAYKTKTLVWPYDMDVDGENDFVTYDGETVKLITNRSSASHSETELFKSTSINNVLFKDFDKDGDIDILFNYAISGNWNSTLGIDEYTNYFIFLRNNGNGTFRKKESNIFGEGVGYYSLETCRDYDGDGLYELLIHTSSNYRNFGKLLKVNNDFTLTEYPEAFSVAGTNEQVWGEPMLGDFNNDGMTEWYSNGGTWYGHLNSQTIRNTVPQKMEKPKAILQPETGRLKITWQRGTDNETSACDLTYELRIGTAPGKCDIMRPASLEDGRRKTLREGEMGTALYKLFNAKALKPGMYYIAVQAIDAGGLGGPFSDDFVYEHVPSAPAFTANMHTLSTGDTLQVHIKAPNADASYEWILSEGEILEQYDNSALIQFHEMGNHTVTLAMTLDGIVYKSEPQIFYVDAAKSDKYIRGSVFDINQDGYADALYHISRLYYGGWKNPLVAFQNDGNGNLSEVKLSVFSDLTDAFVLYVTDYDRDGYPDIIMNGADKGNLFLNYGEQDFDFDYETIDFKYNIITPYMNISTIKYGVDCTDLNNDGHADIINGSHLIFNLGDDVTYDELELTSGTYIDCNFYDVNRDGFLDVVKKTEESEYSGGIWNYEYTWTAYFKDNTENMNYANQRDLFKMTTHVSNYKLADLNNDGVVDLIYSVDNDSTLYILKGSSDGVATETIKIKLPFKMSNIGLNDINNDGFLDICFGSGIILVKQNFTFEVVETKTTGYYSESTWMVFKDGGYPGGMTGTIRNAKPSAPATVAAKQTADGLLITWADAADDHTPAMQMRYNVSVKRKGKSGPGAYIISPMNGESDVATIVSNYIYKQSTQMLVPANLLTVGETYEIRVQAIDLWNEVSPMTSPIEFTMTNDGYINVPEQVATGREVTVKFIGAKVSTYSIDAGQDGKVVQDLGEGQYIISWSSSGLKQISIKAGNLIVKSNVTVVDPIDLTIKLPENIYAGAEMPIRMSDSYAENASTCSLRVYSRKYVGYLGSFVEENIDVKYTQVDNLAYVTFPKTGTYYFEVISEDPVRGGSNEFDIDVTSVMPEAKIARVDVDEQTNRYAVSWKTSTLPADITKVVVMKEGKSLNQFNVLDTVSVEKGSYIDMSSSPAAMSARYQIKLVSSYGQVSEPSVAHRPLHVMLTSAAKGYHLIWDRYEGIDVDNYKILRGTSPDNLTLIEQVAGSLQSYTDLSPADGINYYTVVFTPVGATSRSKARRTIPNGDISSNVISSEGAFDAIRAESIEIMMVNENAKLSEKTPELQLYSIVKPGYCTLDKVEWNIVEGANLATIDDNGRLKIINGNSEGTVVVQARTLDGSNLTARQNVTVEAMSIPSLVGDVNGDELVNGTDLVALTCMIMGQQEENAAADVYVDGQVNGTDYVALVDIILNFSVSSARSMAARGTSNSSLMAEVGVEPFSIATGESQTMIITLDNPNMDVTLVQFDLTLPKGLKLMTGEDGYGVEMTGRTTWKDHTVYLGSLSEESVRMILASGKNAPIDGNSGGILNLTLVADENYDGGDIMLTNILCTSPDIQEYRPYDYTLHLANSSPTGIDSIEEKQKPVIYNISGQRISAPRKGINIINGKKVVFK